MKEWTDEQIDYYYDEYECHGYYRLLDFIEKDFNLKREQAIEYYKKYIRDYEKIKAQRMKEILQ